MARDKIQSSEIMFKGVSSKDIGLTLGEIQGIPFPSQRDRKIVIPGKSGYTSYSEDIEYNEFIFTAEVYLEDTNINVLKEWLTGQGALIHPYAPDQYYIAECINQIPFEKIAKDFNRAVLVFNCQPIGYLLEGQEEISKTGQGTISFENKERLDSKPVIEIVGNGTFEVIVGDNTFKVENVKNKVIIDSERDIVYGAETNYESKSTGELPVIPIGKSTMVFKGTGITSIKVKPNWRRL